MQDQYPSNQLCLNDSPHISHIIENIYLGNLLSSNNQELLKHYNIKAIVRILNQENILVQKINDKDKLDINFHYIGIFDLPWENIIKFIPSFMEFLEINKNSNILIHCAMGISRSASFTIIYLINKYNMSYDDALYFTKSKRKIINPNGGFILQIKKYYDSKMNDIFDKYIKDYKIY